MDIKNAEVYNRKANGKLLLTSEYFVLDGAQALALPTVFGQKMIVQNSEKFAWTSYNNKYELWINDEVSNLKFQSNNLNQLFDYLRKEKVELNHAFHFNTYLDFPNEWGLGSSSTFIALISDFYNINSYKLNRELFRGSSYDIACSFAKNPIIYSNQSIENPSIINIEIPNQIKPFLYFIYLGQKQNSRDAISHYHSLGLEKERIITDLNSITNELVVAQSHQQWIELLTEHESIISQNLKLKKVSDTILKDLPYFSKSLGAWGGDFAMIITDDDYTNVVKNVKKLGLDTIFRYKELILQ